MKIALIDNGSLAPAAHRALRAAAVEIARRAGAGAQIDAVSWKHSDRIPPAELGGRPAWTVEPWIRAQLDRGEDEFRFVPFFISPRGAIGSALRADLEALRRQTAATPWTYAFTGGLAADAPSVERVLAEIVADRVRSVIAERKLCEPALVVVDHGGPSTASANLRNRVAATVAARLGPLVRATAAASMEPAEGPGLAFNRPLLAEVLTRPDFAGRCVIAPLFLLPGRHAGPEGDLARIARAAGGGHVFADLVGNHPLTHSTLAAALREALPSLSFNPSS